METEMNRPNEPGPTAHDVMNEGAKAYDETRRAMGHAYQQSSQAFSRSYDQAMEYGRSHPGKTALIAFGVGVGIGMLLLGSSRRSGISRYGEPVVNALSDMALQFIRRI